MHHSNTISSLFLLVFYLFNYKVCQIRFTCQNLIEFFGDNFLKILKNCVIFVWASASISTIWQIRFILRRENQSLQQLFEKIFFPLSLTTPSSGLIPINEIPSWTTKLEHYLSSTNDVTQFSDNFCTHPSIVTFLLLKL